MVYHEKSDFYQDRSRSIKTCFKCFKDVIFRIELTETPTPATMIPQTQVYDMMQETEQPSTSRKHTATEEASEETISSKKVKFEKEEETAESKPLTSKQAAAQGSNNNEGDQMEDIITCSICSEIMHDCVSLQPCLHTYCAGCYSEWMTKSKECPICKRKVERIAKNHIVNNIVESYLSNYPEKRRTEEDLKLLDAKNKITQDMVIEFK
jgi:E3 ubiquitin-protein ligase CHFR